MDFLDKNQDGTIDYDEFLQGIRVSLAITAQGQLNEPRQKVVDQAFVKFDKDGSGYIDMADIRYCAVPSLERSTTRNCTRMSLPAR